MTSDLADLLFAMGKLALGTISTATLFLPASAKLSLVQTELAVVGTGTSTISVGLRYSVDKSEAVDDAVDWRSTWVDGTTILLRSPVLLGTSGRLAIRTRSWDRKHARSAGTRHTNHRRHVATIGAKLGSTRMRHLRVSRMHAVLKMGSAVASVHSRLVIVLLAVGYAWSKSRRIATIGTIGRGRPVGIGTARTGSLTGSIAQGWSTRAIVLARSAVGWGEACRVP